MRPRAPLSCRELETRPATVGPFDYASDYGEGRAKFVGPKGEFAIEKRDRQWVIHDDRRELEIHDLDHEFGDERVFRDALSGYLLPSVRVGAAGLTNGSAS